EESEQVAVIPELDVPDEAVPEVGAVPRRALNPMHVGQEVEGLEKLGVADYSPEHRREEDHAESAPEGRRTAPGVCGTRLQSPPTLKQIDGRRVAEEARQAEAATEPACHDE